MLLAVKWSFGTIVIQWKATVGETCSVGRTKKLSDVILNEPEPDVSIGILGRFATSGVNRSFRLTLQKFVETIAGKPQ